MGHLIFAGLSFFAATTFSWTMQRLRDDVRSFRRIRLQMLADPARALALHCGQPETASLCQLRVSLRQDGTWEDACNHRHPDALRIERYYQMTLTCSLPLLERPLPPLVTTIKR